MEYAVIFDMDGVIIDSNPYHRMAWGRFLDTKGIVISDDVFKNQIFGTTGSGALRRLIGEGLTEGEVEAFKREIEGEYRDIIRHLDGVEPVNGLVDFMESIKNGGHKIALATSAPAENVELVLNRFGIYKLFDLMVDITQVTKGKPDPEIYQMAVNRLSISKRQCVVFEDSISGITAAKCAGLVVIGVTTSHSSEELKEAGAVFTIGDFSEISLEKVLEVLQRAV